MKKEEIKKEWCNEIKFNYEFAQMFKKAINNGYVSTINKEYRELPLCFQVMLAANELFAYSAKGKYPENDLMWVENLCLENLQALEELYEEVADDSEETMEFAYQMYVCELTAKTVDELAA